MDLPASKPALASGSSKIEFSVVIPVFNSVGVVGETIDRTVAFFAAVGAAHEIIAVNDGSTDQSRAILEHKTQLYPQLTVVNLDSNRGQRAATMCGLERSTGDTVVTMDDDLQHPPEQLDRLIAKARAGHDVVFAKFERKYDAFHLQLASIAVSQLTRALFGPGGGIDVSSFRLLRREVVDRMLKRAPTHPYVTGLAILCACNPTDVLVEQGVGIRRPSTYTLAMRLRLLPPVVANAPKIRIALVGIVALGAMVLAIGAALAVTELGVSMPMAGIALLLLAGGAACLISLDRRAKHRRRSMSQALAYDIADVTTSRLDDQPR